MHFNSENKIETATTVTTRSIVVPSTNNTFSVLSSLDGITATITLTPGTYLTILDFASMVYDKMLDGIREILDVQIFGTAPNEKLSFVFDTINGTNTYTFVGASSPALSLMGFYTGQDVTSDSRGIINAPVIPRYTSNTITTTNGNPDEVRFDVSNLKNLISKFDPDRPLYLSLESFYSEKTPTTGARMFSFIWNEMPGSSQFGTNAKQAMCLSHLYANAGTMTTTTYDTLGITILPSQLVSNNTWSFKCLMADDSVVDLESILGAFMFTLVIYQCP